MVAKNSECEFCGKKKVIVACTPFGCYCKDCLQLILDECDQGIEEIQLKTWAEE